MKDSPERQPKHVHLLYKKWQLCIGSDIEIGSCSVSIPIQGLTVDRLNAEGGTNSALWPLRGNSHQLFLYDGSSKDYAGQASLCSDLASLQLATVAA